jgi:hypothetical protein
LPHSLEPVESLQKTKEPMMKITATDSRDGKVIVIVKTNDNKSREIMMTTIEAATLIGALRASLEEAIGHPTAESTGLPGIHHVQYNERNGEIFFRVYMSDRIYHEYPIPRNTTLATELKLFAERVEARNLAKATHSPPDSPSGKH